jgi:hypothetical protein
MTSNLVSIHIRRFQQKSDVLELSVDARRVILHSEHLHGDQMLRLKNRDLPSPWTLDKAEVRKQLPARLVSNIYDIDPAEIGVGVKVIRISGRSVKGLIALVFEECHERVLSLSVCYDVQVKCGPYESVRSHRDSSDNSER